MTDRLLERMGAACGIVYAMLIYVGSGIGGTTSTVGISLVLLGLLFFLFFLGSLWATLRRAEGGSAWLSTTGFGAGLTAVTIGLGGAAPVLAARYRSGTLDPQLARTLLDIEEASFFLTFLPLAVLLAAFAIVAIRSGVLPGWLGWFAAVLSAAFLFGGLAGSIDLEFEWAALPMLLYPFWVVPTSVVLLRRAGQPHPVERDAHVGPAAPVG